MSGNRDALLENERYFSFEPINEHNGNLILLSEHNNGTWA